MGCSTGHGVQVAKLWPQPWFCRHSNVTGITTPDKGSHPRHITSSLQNHFFGAFGVNSQCLPLSLSLSSKIVLI